MSRPTPAEARARVALLIAVITIAAFCSGMIFEWAIR